MESGRLAASVAGTVDRVNKLISVRAPKPRQASASFKPHLKGSSFRYSGEVGDVVVGRVIEVSHKSWKVDCNSRQNVINQKQWLIRRHRHSRIERPTATSCPTLCHHAVLLLSSVYLPDGVQRRRTQEDQLQMREFYKEGARPRPFGPGSIGDGIATSNVNRPRKAILSLPRCSPSSRAVPRQHALSALQSPVLSGSKLAAGVSG